jgi:hypothetical protein
MLLLEFSPTTFMGFVVVGVLSNNQRDATYEILPRDSTSCWRELQQQQADLTF